MSAKLVGKALDTIGVTASEKLVLIALADRTNKDTGRCTPSLERIAEQIPNRAGDGPISERQVRNLIRSLERKGLVYTVPRSGTSNQYHVLPEAGSALPGSGRNWSSGAISGGAEVQISGGAEVQISGEPEGTAKQPWPPHHYCRAEKAFVDFPIADCEHCPTEIPKQHQEVHP